MSVSSVSVDSNEFESRFVLGSIYRPSNGRGLLLPDIAVGCAVSVQATFARKRLLMPPPLPPTAGELRQKKWQKTSVICSRANECGKCCCAETRSRPPIWHLLLGSLCVYVSHGLPVNAVFEKKLYSNKTVTRGYSQRKTYLLCSPSNAEKVAIVYAREAGIKYERINAVCI